MNFLFDILSGGSSNIGEAARQRPQAVTALTHEQDAIVLNESSTHIDLWRCVTAREFGHESFDALDGHDANGRKHLVGDRRDLFIPFAIELIAREVKPCRCDCLESLGVTEP